MGKKVTVKYSEKFAKNVQIELNKVLELIEQNKEKISSEILERGKQSDDSEFLTIKFIVAK